MGSCGGGGGGLGGGCWVGWGEVRHVCCCRWCAVQAMWRLGRRHLPSWEVHAPQQCRSLISDARQRARLLDVFASTRAGLDVERLGSSRESWLAVEFIPANLVVTWPTSFHETCASPRFLMLAIPHESFDPSFPGSPSPLTATPSPLCPHAGGRQRGAQAYRRARAVRQGQDEHRCRAVHAGEDQAEGRGWGHGGLGPGWGGGWGCSWGAVARMAGWGL